MLKSRENAVKSYKEGLGESGDFSFYIIFQGVKLEN